MSLAVNAGAMVFEFDTPDEAQQVLDVAKQQANERLLPGVSLFNVAIPGTVGLRFVLVVVAFDDDALTVAANLVGDAGGRFVDDVDPDLIAPLALRALDQLLSSRVRRPPTEPGRIEL